MSNLQGKMDDICQKRFDLNDGSTIPAVGLGTWQGTIEVARFEDVNNNLSGGFGTSDAQALKASIIHALQNGYRLIDTAQYYGVESVVGEAVRESGIKREEITIVTKFWGQFHHDPAKALQKSLNQLNLEYVDIFLMHWPWALTEDGKPLRIAETPTFCETWKMMQELVGPQCHGIGVSNFTQKTLDTLLETASIIPLVNQVELHAFNPCFNLVLFCQSKKIHVISWSTMGGNGDFGKNQILSHDLFTSIAKEHKRSTGVVSLSWAVQRGVTVIPKSSSASRILENIKLITLTEEEMGKMASAHHQIRRMRIAENIKSLWLELDGVQTLQGWTKVDFGWEDSQGNWLT